jgi:hypothetical protein
MKKRGNSYLTRLGICWAGSVLSKSQTIIANNCFCSTIVMIYRGVGIRLKNDCKRPSLLFLKVLDSCLVGVPGRI